MFSDDLVDTVDRFDHVDRDTDGPCLVRDGTADRLADPPCRIGGELVPFFVFELVDGFHEADVPLLDEVEEWKPSVCVTFGNGDDQSEVRLRHTCFGHFAFGLTLTDLFEDRLEFLFGEVEPAFARFSGLEEFLYLHIGTDHRCLRYGIDDVVFIHIDDIVEYLLVVLPERVVEEGQFVLETLELFFETVIAFECRLHRFDQFIDEFGGRPEIEQGSFELLFFESDLESFMNDLDRIGLFFKEGFKVFTRFHPVFFGFFEFFETLYDLFDPFVIFGYSRLAALCSFAFSSIVICIAFVIFETFKKLFDASFTVEKRLFVIEDITDEIGNGTDRIDDDVLTLFDTFG